MKLNEKIHYYRTRAKLSQEELAAQVGVSRQAVSKWELGEATPEVSKLALLAKAFGVTTDELLREEAPQEKPAEEAQKPPENAGGPDYLDRAAGLLDRLARRYGWLMGVYIAAIGLIFTLFGGLGRFLFTQLDALMGAPSAWSGVGSITLLLPTAILVFGLVLLAAGAALAVALYRKNNR